MNSRAARTLRGLIVACFATFVAAFSHVAVGGTAPGIVGLALGLAFAVLVCVALAGKSLSVPRLSIAVGLSQLVFHLIFSLGGTSDVTAVMTGHHGSMVSFVTDPGMSMASDPLMQGCTWMWAAHGAAAILTVLALTRGEAALRSLLEVARVSVRRLIVVPFVEPLAPTMIVSARFEPEPSHLRDLGVFLGSMRHRGPPVGVPATA